MGRSRNSEDSKSAGLSRRDFLTLAGVTAVGAGMGVLFPQVAWLDDGVAAFPASEGYLLVDVKKCQGCQACVLACSLVHHGRISPDLARIQVVQDPFEKFPHDINLAQCRQCVDPHCVKACPTKALHVDVKNGNVRRITAKKCIGCGQCLHACPYEPGRVFWNAEGRRAQKCDLCLEAPHWDAQGGPAGKQACVEICPIGAITFTRTIPEQKGEGGYQVNLRRYSWTRLGYSVE